MALSLSFVRCSYTAIAIVTIVLSLSDQFHARRSLNVLSYGATPNGAVDSTQAFSYAWKAACETADSTVIYVPRGRYLIGQALRFEGESCGNRDITLRIDGTLIGPQDYGLLAKQDYWINFVGVNGVTIVGGSFDAKGSSLWSCKANGHDCPEGATTIRFVDSNNVKIKGLLSLNSQLFHIAINRCRNVKIEDVQIIAPDQSPNTDGIHIQLSTDVEIRNASIKTGDDCISIGPGTKNLWIERVTCGPGHGISIGSLGKAEVEQGVQNVTVKKAVFVRTDNGLRIKSWPKESNGFVQRVRFLGAVMVGVRFPILIDQNYCPGDSQCPPQESGIRINDVIYGGIMGTSSTKIAIKMDCSEQFPCTRIRMQNINLTYYGDAAVTSCSNVVGSQLGFVIPKGCL
ncbi:PREDICTED: polygalacturonase-like [Tarenaya hassleriana]|uniref:polygalacturonase-like n=1 Tax=Tarenaya hassleriana TaxID=28532 RepID=UPI00053C7DB7|nr:PREDICTED: polygalacturonase-like [Tarenaya hassleriana]